MALGLSGVYVIWLFVLILLYPPCRWFAELKHSLPHRALVELCVQVKAYRPGS
jgi:hypothetical protein